MFGNEIKCARLWDASCKCCRCSFFRNTVHFTRLTAIFDARLLTEFTFPLASQRKHGQGNGLLWHAGCGAQRHPWWTEEVVSQTRLKVSPRQKPCRRREGALLWLTSSHCRYFEWPTESKNVWRFLSCSLSRSHRRMRCCQTPRRGRYTTAVERRG